MATQLTVIGNGAGSALPTLDPRHEAELFNVMRLQMQTIGNVARIPEREWQEAPLHISRYLINREKTAGFSTTHVHVGNPLLMPPKIGGHNGGMRCLIRMWDMPSVPSHDPTLLARKATDALTWSASHAVGNPPGQACTPHAAQLKTDLCEALDALPATARWRDLPDAGRERLLGLLLDASVFEAHTHGLLALRAAIVPFAATPFIEGEKPAASATDDDESVVPSAAPPFIEGDPDEFFLVVTCADIASGVEILRHVTLGPHAADVTAQIQGMASVAAGPLP